METKLELVSQNNYNNIFLCKHRLLIYNIYLTKELYTRKRDGERESPILE